MIRKSTAAAALAAAALAIVAAPASADSLFGSSGGSSSGSAGLLDAGSSALGSSSKEPEHYGTLGRPDAPNGLKSINVWVYAPKANPIGDGVYPKNSQLGVRWNSTIAAGNVIDGNECQMAIRLTGPKVPAKAAVTKTEDCTSAKLYTLRAPGAYTISVTDGISGASNSIRFSVQ